MFTFQKIIFILWLLIFTLFGTACTEENLKTTDEDTKPMEVNVHTVKRQTYPLWVQFSGKTEAVNEVVTVSRVSGEIKEQLFEAGDFVTKGQILFRIDKNEYQVIWDQKYAILEKDKASLNLAIANVKRYKPLVAEQLAPREKLDELIATKKQLEATIKADNAALRAAKLNLNYCDVKASIDGHISKELVLIGNIVNQGTELNRIVQTDHLYINFNPSSDEVVIINKYKSEEKPKVKVSLRNSKHSNLELDGKVNFIDNISNASTGTVAMRAKISNSDKLLYPGSFVQVKLFLSDDISIIAVHPDQISQNQQGQFVYIINNKNEIKIKQIKQAYVNNNLAIISKGLKEGDRVIVDTIHALIDGLKVTPIEVINPINF